MNTNEKMLPVGTTADRPVVGRVRRVVINRMGDSFAVSVDGRLHHVDAARVDGEAVVEPRWLDVADMRFKDKRLDAQVAQALIAPGEPLEVFDPRHLEPDEVIGVVRDPLRVCLGEADANLG